MTKEQRIMSKEQSNLRFGTINKMRKKPVFSLSAIHCSLLTVLCSLFIVSCEGDPGFMQRIDDEVAWSNASRLSVTVAIPAGWGFSPQGGPNRCFDNKHTRENPRLGYEFNVEFSPESGYGFVEWLAFNGNEYSLDDVAVMDLETARAASLNEQEAEIEEAQRTQTGAFASDIRINVNVPIMLVPFCDKRPQVSRSNPPLIPALSPFPYDQRIVIWFNMPIDISTVVMGESIRFNATDRTGSPTGDISDYFTVSEYDVLQYRLVIAPVNSLEKPSVDLQRLSIAVEIGRGIISDNGENSLEMPAVQIISYLTDTTMAQKVYESSNIRASRDGNLYFDNFDGLWRDENIDRRFNKGRTPDYNTVHIRFSLADIPEGAPAEPNKVSIYERLNADLSGFGITPADVKGSFDYDLPPPGLGNIYSISHNLDTSRSGIIQLIVIPWSDIGEEEYRMERDSAFSGGHFVTIVMDNAPPAIGDLGAVLNGTLIDDTDGVKYYNFARGANLTLTLERLSFLNDNGNQGGIHYSEAFNNRPWTMDDRASLEWRVTVGNIAIDADSVWEPVWNGTEINNTFGPVSLTGLSENQHTVTVELRDRMGNESKSEPVKFQIVAGAPLPVTGLSALCTETGPPANRITQITVKWTTATDTEAAMLGARIYINDRFETTVTETGTQSYTFTVSPINANNVRDEQPVSNVTRYDIRVVGFNAAGSAAAEVLAIWNIPGMDVTQTNTTLISSVTDLRLINTIGLGNANANRNFILVNDIELPAEWTPIGTNTATTTFQGKFYGNGHTITINSFTTVAADRVNLGLFNFVNNALIRDLAVVYNTEIPANSSTGRFGGITAYAAGTTKILNTIVNGKISSGEISTTTIQRCFGGITGGMSNTSAISNCLSALDMDITTTGTTAVFFGGCVGDTQSGGNVGTDNRPTHTGLEGITVRANLKLMNQGTSTMLAGGVIGRGLAVVKYISLEYSGSFTIIRTETGGSYIGGITGDSYTETQLHRIVYSNLRVNGSITVPPSYMSMTDPSLAFGGLFGRSLRTIIDDGIVTADLRCDKTGTGSAYFGGLIGTVASFSEVTNCRYEQGNITTDGEGQVYAGGGFGRVGTDSFVINCSSNASLLNVSRDNHHILVGGLIGELFSASITRCFAQTDIKAEGNAIVYTGGLIGRWESGSDGANNNTTYEVSECFATGNVSALTTSTSDIAGGGLIGRVIRTQGTGGKSIKNSYATGNVTVDRRSSTGEINAGGLIGVVWDSTADSTRIYNIRNNFAVGNVSTKSINTAAVRVGGLVGYINVVSGTASTASILQNNAALGSSVTAMGSDASAARTGRIFGVSNINNNFNYARDDMRVEISSNYNDSFPPALIFDTIAPVMTGTPVLSEIPAPVLGGTPVLQGSDFIPPVLSGTPSLSGTLDAASISGISVSDTGGSDFANATMTVGRNPNSAGGSPSWNGTNITSIDLTGFTDISHYLRFFFTLKDNAGNTAYYNFEMRPKRNNKEFVSEIIYEEDEETIKEIVVKEIIVPLEIGDFIITNPNLIHTTTVSALINGILINDTSGSGIVNTSMTVTSNRTDAGGNPVWTGNSITGIDLSGLTNTDDHLRFDFNTSNNAGSSSVYRIDITRNASGSFILTGPTLQSENRIRSIGGIFINDEGGSGLANVSMRAERNPAGGNSPVWNGNSITRIDLSGLTANNHYWRFDFTLQDNAGNSSVYRIQATRNATDSFVLSGPTLQGTPVIVRSAASSQHGEAVTGSTFFNSSFWTRTTPNGLGFSPTNWNFNFVVGRGYPQLAWE